MVIVDLSVLRYSHIYLNIKNSNLKLNYNYYFHSLVSNILYLKKKFNVCKNNRMILAIDKQDKFTYDNKEYFGYWRHQLYLENKNTIGDKYTGYKAGRRQNRDETIDWKRLDDIYYDVVDIFDKYSDFQVLKIPCVEADDILAVLSQLSKKQTILVTNDKDMKTLINDRVKYYDTDKKTFVDEMTDYQKEIFYLNGDIADTIPKVKIKDGDNIVGWKKFNWEKKLLEKSLDEYFIEFPELKEKYEINKKLMSLNINDLPKEIVKKILYEVKTKKYDNYSKFKLMNAIKKYNINNIINEDSIYKPIIERLDEFKLQDNNIEKEDENNTMKYLNNKNEKERLIQEMFFY